MSQNLHPLTNSQSRVYLIEGRARPDHVASYESCMKMAGLTRGLGDTTTIECPDPDNYGKFIEIGEIKGALERPTTSLEGRYSRDLKSTLLRLARAGCAMDIQLHMGACKDPKDFDSFDKVLILENASLTNFSTDDLGSLASGDNGAVDEKADVTAADAYEVVPLSFAERAGSILTNEAIDAIFCDSQSCGECATESNGCKKIFVLTKAAGGSPASPADIVYSIDGGSVWYATDVNSLGAAVEPDALACVGNYIVVISAADLALHYALKSEFDGTTTPAFTKVTTGFVAGGGPKAIVSYGSMAFIVGANGYIYVTTDPTAGVTVLDAGVATPNTLLAVDALSDTFAVAVGGNSTIVKTLNGETWGLVTTTPSGAGINYTSVLLISESLWMIGTSNGYAYYTLDGGVTWKIIPFPGYGTGKVQDIVKSTDSVIFLSHTTAATKGRILRSINGGNTWKVLPDVTGTMPAADRFTALAACQFDPNIVVGAGLGDNGSDGIIVLGYGA